jgi:putative acetyltransferase
MNHPSLLSVEKNPALNFSFRPIRPEDNRQVARLIRTVMSEFACVGEGYSIMDSELEDMFAAYNHPKAAFFVITSSGDDEILGCGGIAPLAGGEGDTCELKKMYFYPALRGYGLGRRMLELCLETARNLGFRRCYLETVDRMTAANALYQKMGFERMDAPMGATGHCSCEGWYVKEL